LKRRISSISMQKSCQVGKSKVPNAIQHRVLRYALKYLLYTPRAFFGLGDASRESRASLDCV
jgi:hypothetical protein